MLTWSRLIVKLQVLAPPGRGRSPQSSAVTRDRPVRDREKCDVGSRASELARAYAGKEPAPRLSTAASRAAGGGQTRRRRLTVGDYVKLAPGVSNGCLKGGKIGVIRVDDKTSNPFKVRVGSRTNYYRENEVVTAGGVGRSWKSDLRPMRQCIETCFEAFVQLG